MRCSPYKPLAGVAVLAPACVPLVVFRKGRRHQVLLPFSILRLRRWGHTPRARFGTDGRISSSISQGALSSCKLHPIATPARRNDEIAKDPPRPFECRSDCQPDHAVDDSRRQYYYVRTTTTQACRYVVYPATWPPLAAACKQ